MTVISSIYIATITPSILKHEMGRSVSFVDFCRPENNPFVSTTNFKKVFPAQNYILNLLHISLSSNKHLLSLYWSCKNVAESSLLPHVLSPFYGGCIPRID